MEARNLAIMLTDIKGFTSKTAAFSRAQTQELLTRHRELVMPVIEKFKGRLVKTIGDAFLVVFNSPTDAVICGVEIQAVLRAFNEGRPQAEKIEIRIAINSGEVSVHDDGDIYGDPVNITSRLESIAEAGEVFFTESVYLAMNKKEVPSSEIGYRQFKGVPEKIKVFRVLREVPVGGQPQEPVCAEEPARAPAAQGVPQAAPHAPAEPAGVRRRLVSLLLDVAIFMMITGTLGLRSCGPGVKVEARDSQEPPPVADMNIEDVKIGKNGIRIVGEKGETISIGKSGTVIKGADGKVWKKNEKLEVGVGSSKKKVPLTMALWVAYMGLLIWRFGGTFGMKILKLRAVDFATGAPLPADKAFLRAFFSLVSLFMLAGYVWAIWEKDRRTWHDIIAGTRIVKA